MNIAFVLPKPVGGGAEKSGMALANALAKHHNVHIFFVCRQADSPIDLGDCAFTYEFVKDVAYKGLRYKLSRDKLKLRVDYVRKRKRALGINCTISFLEESNYINVRSRRNDKAIVSIRNCYSRKFADIARDDMVWNRLDEAMHMSDHVVAISEGVRYDLKVFWPQSTAPISVIYNPCDVDAIQAKASAQLPSEIEAFVGDSPLVVSLGRHVEQKGQWHLVRAFARVVERVPSAKLIICGAGPMQQRLLDVRTALHLEDSVLIVPYLENPLPVLRRADVFAFPSLFEGLGNALIEAMAVGVPIVSTDCPYGPREILAPGTEYRFDLTSYEKAPYGILCPQLSGDPLTDEPLQPAETEFADALCEVLCDEEVARRYRESSRERSMAFASETIVAQWEQLIAGLTT